MQRMPHLFVTSGLALACAIAAGPRASASLIRPDAPRVYPDLHADVNGTIGYEYDPATRTGLFQMRNTPYMLVTGPDPDQEFAVQPVVGDGDRHQRLSLRLDRDGKLRTDLAGQTLAEADNSYELYGTVTARGRTFSGLLLKGTPVAFGFQDLDPVGIRGGDRFDVELNITGGALAQYFGRDAYMSIAPEKLSTFHGRFDEDFDAAKATSNTTPGRTSPQPPPFPVPEPATLIVLVAGGGGLIAFRRARTPK